VTGVTLAIIGRNNIPDECNFDTQKCQPGATPEITNDRNETAGRGHGLYLTGLVIGVSGAVVAVGGLVWHFLEPTGPEKQDPPAKDKSTQWSLAPVFNGTSGSLFLSSAF
jgi:hypothetical protein